MKNELQWKLGFLTFAEEHFISARDGEGLGALMRAVHGARGGHGAPADAKVDARHDGRGQAAGAPKTGLIRPKLRYAHQGRGKSAAHHHPRQRASDRVPTSYQRYLEGYFREPSSSSARRSDRVPRRPQPLLKKAR